MGQVRLELVADFGPEKGKVLSGILIDRDSESLRKAVQNKLKLKKKELGSLIFRAEDDLTMVILPEGDLKEHVKDGMRIVVLRREVVADLESSTKIKPLPPKVQSSVDSLRSIAIGAGHLSARGRPSAQVLAALQQQKGITAVVTLMGNEEQGAADQIGRHCESLGMKWCHAPLHGPAQMKASKKNLHGFCLTEEDIESFRSVSQVKKWLADGESVVIHCAAGLHRTGIYLYVLLREMQESPASAMAKIAEIRELTYAEFWRHRFLLSADHISSNLGNLTAGLQEVRATEAILAIEGSEAILQGRPETETATEDILEETVNESSTELSQAGPTT